VVSTPELESLLEQAIVHVNAGELEEGRTVLERVLEQDPQNDRAWVWLSGCVEDPKQREICLGQALRVNPDNQAALDGMKVLAGELVQASQVTPSLLESRLSAIGMGEQYMSSSSPSVSPTPLDEAEAAIAEEPADVEFVEQPDVAETGVKRGSRRLLLLVVALLILFVIVAVLVYGVIIAPAL
jgi:hypothetical protein